MQYYFVVSGMNQSFQLMLASPGKLYLPVFAIRQYKWTIQKTSSHINISLPNGIQTILLQMTKPSQERYNSIINISKTIPEFTIEQKVNPYTNKFSLSTDINSVFDIARSTLAKILFKDSITGAKNQQDNHSENI